MRKTLKSIYYFLPIQLFLLQFRKYQLLLIFWFILFATITGNFASHFGASSLFLAPEYLGHINFLSMLLLGCCTSIFIMTWHITTFIIHSKRIPYMGARRHAFLIYCFNNSLLPLIFLVFYSIVCTRFQLVEERTSLAQVILLQLGFYLGFIIVAIVSFAYFFRVGRDLLKIVLSKITNPSVIREIIPYDTLDYEIDIVPATTYLSGTFRIQHFADLESYPSRILATIFRRHHRNAVFATIASYLLLLFLGIFMHEPAFRIPAGGSFLILFSIMMGIAAAFKYFMRTWETIGLVITVSIIITMVHYGVMDLRSIANGINNKLPVSKQPQYTYEHLHQLFNHTKYQQDKQQEESRLDKWKTHVADSAGKEPPLIVVTVSGGGLRSAYWTFHALQYIDSITHGMLFKNTVLLTGASGGMIGAAYWRAVHDDYQQGKTKDPYNIKYQVNIGKDILNAIIFSFASVDFISPFNKITVAGHTYTKDRGYAMEEELIRNTDGVLDKKIGDTRAREANGTVPQILLNSTVVNDGRRLMISSQPVAYLTRPEYTLADTVHPPIDAIDYAALFANCEPYNMRLTSALRMNATFPFILPIVKLPSQPHINVMDAGMRDNFGTESASRYIYALRNWMQHNTHNVIILEVRDTREYEVFKSTDETSVGGMISDPLFIIQNKWEVFQSYNHGYLKDYATSAMDGKLHFVTLQYVPKQKIAALNFHLTQTEKNDLYNSIYNSENQDAIKQLLQLMQ
ncbi:MAG: hypothetical protein P4L41_08050 [Flavipsychrobacter sp.]|nr:hypothetical protein [Flavipsychrobacter sp.]